MTPGKEKWSYSATKVTVELTWRGPYADCHSTKPDFGQQLAGANDTESCQPSSLDELPAAMLPVRLQAAKRCLPPPLPARSPFPGLLLIGMRITFRGD